jgi:hypothetical protein
MFAVVVVLLNALNFASLAYIANRKGYHAMAALAAAGAWLFGVTGGLLIWGIWRKRSINAVPVLSAAGLSLSLASAAIGRPAADMPTSHEITLCEEEISDVSLAKFYVFDDENAGTFRRRIKLAAGGCGGCGGCGDGGGGEGCASSYSGAAPFGTYVTPPRYSKPTRKRRAGA